MILQVADSPSYNKEQIKKLEPYLGKPITIEQLAKLPALVGVAVALVGSNDNILYIDHPYAW